MNLKQIEDEALHQEDVGADLRVRPDEIEEDWLIEARRRARELDEGIVQPIPADEIRKKARALLR